MAIPSEGSYCLCFSRTFVDGMHVILLSTGLFIKINGTARGFFSCDRGVRHGDPLSPLLFCIAEDVLSAGISKLIQSGSRHPISSPMGVFALC